MMKNLMRTVAVALMTIAANVSAQTTDTLYNAPLGKEIYIPKDLKSNDFTKSDSKWSYSRCAYTDDIIVFWEKPFGNDLSKAPQLKGHNMNVDINNLLEKLQSYYNYFKNDLQFIQPGSNADKYRMMVMLNYSLEGTAYGGDYDGVIGALWIAPNRVQDKKLNCIAHELGHSFQSQVACDGKGESWGGGGIFEMTSQWMLWMVNPEWTTDENYHWLGFISKHNLRFLDIENIYHSPYVLEYWSLKHGKTIMADLFRAGKRGEDPASTYMRINNMTISQMNDEMCDCYSRLVTFDFPRVKESHKQFIGQLVTPMASVNTRKETHLTPLKKHIPQTWGFNVVELPTTDNNDTYTVSFEGYNKTDNATYKTRIVSVDSNGNATYSNILTGAKGKFKFKVKPSGGKSYLIVVGCPSKEYKPYTFNPYDKKEDKKAEEEYPYSVKIK